MDIIAIILRDTNISSRDDYKNIEKVDFFSYENKQLLREMNGLRNRIIHRYNGTDDSLALAGITQSTEIIRNLIRVIEKWINNH